MGQHTLRRASGISTTTGRAIFTGIAALGLVSGGAGMAFAGEASTYSSDHDVKGDHDDEGDHDGHDSDHDSDDEGHGTKHHEEKHHHDKHDEKPEACEIPVEADASRATDELVNDATDDATRPANDAVAAAAKPVDDAICAAFAPLFYEADELAGHGPKDDYKYQGESPSGLEDPAKH